MLGGVDAPPFNDGDVGVFIGASEENVQRLAVNKNLISLLASRAKKRVITLLSDYNFSLKNLIA